MNKMKTNTSFHGWKEAFIQWFLAMGRAYKWVKTQRDTPRESSSSSLNDDVQQSPEEVIPPQTNTQSIHINMVPNGDEASTSHNVFNERLEDAYFDASISFYDPFNVHTYYQHYPHEKKWTYTLVLSICCS
nr:hypothetical protein [Tanacetum cinerariifolium]